MSLPDDAIGVQHRQCLFSSHFCVPRWASETQSVAAVVEADNVIHAARTNEFAQTCAVCPTHQPKTEISHTAGFRFSQSRRIVDPLASERTLEICNGEPSSQTGSEPPFKRLLTISILRGHQNSSLARLPYFFCCRFRRHYFRPRHRLVTVEPRRAERAIALVAPATRRSNSGEASPEARSVTGQRSNAGKVRKALLHRFPDRCGNLLGRGVSVDVL